MASVLPNLFDEVEAIQANAAFLEGILEGLILLNGDEAAPAAQSALIDKAHDLAGNIEKSLVTITPLILAADTFIETAAGGETKEITTPLKSLWARYRALDAMTGLSDEEFKKVHDEMSEIEGRAVIATCLNRGDLAAKILMLTSLGDEDLLPTARDKIKDELFALAAA